MRGLISLLVSFLLVLSFGGMAAGSVEAPKDTKVEKKAEAKPAEAKKSKKPSALEKNCAKCHQGDKDVVKINEAKGIKSSDEMIKLVKKGEKAKIHEKISDKNLKAVGKELFPAKKPADTKKKDAVKTDTEKKPAEKPKKKPEGC